MQSAYFSVVFPYCIVWLASVHKDFSSVVSEELFQVYLAA